ncbi:hypothetical protein NKR19_g3081 [Coniochaeta hoffmannii]|uniref:Yippee domain-containing protein n=1 Tax=Coniochaeta hoffmannii TaxID=91930 RepID=A0AA38S9I1_9PEZI|nr:hypothetical protein NKR19_g3081 [Coniochaeta hoffmannii]
MSPSTSNAPLFPTFLLPSFTLPFRRRATGTRPKWPAVNSTDTTDRSRVPSLSSSPTSTVSDSDPASPLELNPSLYWANPDDQYARPVNDNKSLPPTIHRPQPDTIRCGTCATDLAFGAQIVSKGFTGRYGRAFLVGPPSSLSTTPIDLGLDPRPYGLNDRDAAQLDDSELLNIKIGSRENRQLVTGAHVVADISCAVCGTKVGWKYVQATEQSQKYKEGKFILETQRVVVFRSWEDVEDTSPRLGARVSTEVASWRRTSSVRDSVDSGSSSKTGKDGDHDPDHEVVFDSEDEEECEDIFAGTWDPAVVVKRRQKKVSRLRGKK